jgi:hypothetical protein
MPYHWSRPLCFILYIIFYIRIQIRRGVLDTTICDKVCQSLASGRWFSPDTPVSSTNKTDRHDIAEMLLKVALYTIISPPLLCALFFVLLG